MPESANLPEYRHREIVTAGTPIHVVDLPANRPPLLLIHGIGMDWRVWQSVARRLWPHFHLYFVDLRGHGSSGKPIAGYSLAHYAADIEDIVDALQLSGLTMVGSSLGGMVTAAVEAPADIVSHRILADPPLTGGPIRDAEGFETILRLKHDSKQSLAEYLAATNPTIGRHLATRMSDTWHEAADGVIGEMLAHPADYYAIDSALTAIDAPTLLMQADPRHGAVLTDEEIRRALSLLPRGSAVWVAGAGHAIHGTKPAEFARLVAEFART